MAKKLKNEELENVSGGSCKTRYKCSGCKNYFYGHPWKAKSYGSKTVLYYCDDCAEKLKKDPNYTDWEKEQ